MRTALQSPKPHQFNLIINLTNRQRQCFKVKQKKRENDQEIPSGARKEACNWVVDLYWKLIKRKVVQTTLLSKHQPWTKRLTFQKRKLWVIPSANLTHKEYQSPEIQCLHHTKFIEIIWMKGSRYSKPSYQPRTTVALRSRFLKT